MGSGEDAPGGENAHVVCLCCGERNTNVFGEKRSLRAIENDER